MSDIVLVYPSEEMEADVINFKNDFYENNEPSRKTIIYNGGKIIRPFVKHMIIYEEYQIVLSVCLVI